MSRGDIHRLYEFGGPFDVRYRLLTPPSKRAYDYQLIATDRREKPHLDYVEYWETEPTGIGVIAFELRAISKFDEHRAKLVSVDL